MEKIGSVGKTAPNTEYLEQLYEELKIKDNQILDPAMKCELKAIVKEFQDVFTLPDKAIGKTDLAEFKITLELEAVPKKAKVCPLNPA